MGLCCYANISITERSSENYIWIKWGFGFFDHWIAGQSLNTQSPLWGHAYYGLDEMGTDTNTMAHFQSDYSAKPHQCWPANGRWRPPIQVAGEQVPAPPRYTSEASLPSPSPHAQPISADSMELFRQGASPHSASSALKQSWRLCAEPRDPKRTSAASESPTQVLLRTSFKNKKGWIFPLKILCLLSFFPSFLLFFFFLLAILDVELKGPFPKAAPL